MASNHPLVGHFIINYGLDATVHFLLRVIKPFLTMHHACFFFAAFLLWVPLWGRYLKGSSSVFSLFMVSSVRSVYPNIEDVNPIASRMFAPILKRPLDGQYYCSVLYCVVCFSLDGSILCTVFHFAHGSGRVSRLGDIYPACVRAA
jgi:hypothetical protein